ncbi:phenylalanine--tRNA ligase subunit beta [Coxiella endosymbiont of Amblyomma sculptum]|uniref:phenylalanine--tRNA ligase subunit beta n=1 Tax=Coxiella endosymbiont of Amblyomma sculptum TaxID=2487929 RepID=UPI00132F273F|nr:phenylalanine--tRNA ligase subunit beta [Coxiella endosymbiont of Amblyomma sculptum]QHG92366.1 phenylalanine--tRNA ligase subunit beta [Coxiella endosymbiont of Amblyomma sculptum]
MQLSEIWLREWVNPALDAENLAKRLALFGLEIDSINPVSFSFEKVVVGEVFFIEQHPNTNNLFFCHVNVGKKIGILKIICKAPNIRLGLKVPIALIGGRLGDTKVKKLKLRGFSSHGIICSERELGLVSSENQKDSYIMELPSDAPLGSDLQDYLQLKDSIFDFNLTPNRGDWTSVRGIANEISAIERISVKMPKIESVVSVYDDAFFPIHIQAKKDCPHYVGRVIRDINSNAHTSIWMRERLRRSGVRSIHPVVDVMNYVMLEWGQPMHAFDFDQLSGGIYIRYANSDEKITLIDGTGVSLNCHTLVVADENQAHAIAGIMGSSGSAINEKTKNVFLESAYFTPGNITLTARHYNLNTDSSYRFERGVDFTIQRLAMERATELLLAMTDGKPGPIEDYTVDESYPSIKKISLRRKRIKRLLGIEIPDNEVHQILSSLRMTLQLDIQGWQVTIPSDRFDIVQETDLIEELARLYSYERIPQTVLSREMVILPLPETEVSLSRIRHLMVDRGYNEAISYSFVNDRLQSRFNPNLKFLTLSNPISNDMNVMRNSLWPGLITAVKYNQSHQIKRIRLFEIGTCFIKNGKEKWQQVTKVAGLITENAHNLQWGEAERPIDFYDLKGDISALFSLNRSEKDFHFIRSEHPALHPGQCAALCFGEICIGHMGALHPILTQELNLSFPLYLFEVELKIVNRTQLPRYQPITKFPAVYRAISVIVDRDVEVSQIEEEIFRNSGHLLIVSEIFDVYEDTERIEFGKKSIALRLTLQNPLGTLVDKEIKQVVKRVVSALEHKFKAKLRSVN